MGDWGLASQFKGIKTNQMNTKTKNKNMNSIMLNHAYSIKVVTSVLKLI